MSTEARVPGPLHRPGGAGWDGSAHSARAHAACFQHPGRMIKKLMRLPVCLTYPRGVAHAGRAWLITGDSVASVTP